MAEIVQIDRRVEGFGTGMDATYVFRIDPDERHGGVVLHLWGALDAHTTSEFEYAISRCLNGKPPIIVLDLGELQYVSSAGFGALLDALHSCRDQGSELRLAHMAKSVERVFRMLGLHRTFGGYASVQEALTAGLGASGQGATP